MGVPTWPDLISELVGGRDLPAAEIRWAMGEILQGAASPVQVAAFAVALRTKGETVEELSGMADVMLEFATAIELDREAVDVVGTGGDRANTVNVSTMAAITAAAAGARVVKHGNRAASSACGTADVLEQVGIVLDLPPDAQQGVMDEAGLVFLFAAGYHSSLRHVAAVRRELAVSTTFNFLGPMANPARPNAQAIGVADPRMAGLIAGVLAGRGARGLIFHGGDGLDELTTTTTSRVWLIHEGEVRESVFDPVQLGVPRAEVADLVGGSP
ncbi:MAG: anthranilate phosphoribosyltransferase, partial [Propionibacteriaceae bacterium]|nr:anthranilate phosphoribosyltransferase [Propionibacteriaceae bacterium]